LHKNVLEIIQGNDLRFTALLGFNFSWHSIKKNARVYFLLAEHAIKKTLHINEEKGATLVL
jgi:hypothetical protein